MNAGIKITTSAPGIGLARRMDPEPEYLPTALGAPESLMKRLEVLSAIAAMKGTQQAFMAIRGQLSNAQCGACDWFAERYELYLKAMDAPGIKSGSFERKSKSEPPDPFSDMGLVIAGRDRDALREYQSARLAGLACGRDAFGLFWVTIIDQEKPGGAAVAATRRVAEAIWKHRQKSSRFRRGRR